MSKDHENALLKELSPEESAAIDRIMAQAAAEADAEVDYDGMLKAIKARAKAEGIVVFPGHPAKKKNAVRKVLTGFAAAAAVVAVGFAVYGSVKLLTPAKQPADQRSASVISGDPDNSADTVISSKTPSGIQSSVVPFTPTEEVATPLPTVAAPDPTPFPTDSPITKGVGVGFVDLTSFVHEPTTCDDITPDLPEFMAVKSSGSGDLEVKAFGTSGMNRYYYSARVVKDPRTELSVGVARYERDAASNTIKYMWRITSGSLLEIEFSGFDFDSAQTALLSLLYKMSDRAA